MINKACRVYLKGMPNIFKRIYKNKNTILIHLFIILKKKLFRRDHIKKRAYLRELIKKSLFRRAYLRESLFKDDEVIEMIR